MARQQTEEVFQGVGVPCMDWCSWQRVLQGAQPWRERGGFDVGERQQWGGGVKILRSTRARATQELCSNDLLDKEKSVRSGSMASCGRLRESWAESFCEKTDLGR